MALIFATMEPGQEAEAVLDTEKAAAAVEPSAGVALYVVSNKWFSQWCQYSGFTFDPARSKAKVVRLDQPGPRPGPINNADLLAPPPASSDLKPEQQAGVAALRDGLADKVHFWMLHEPTWRLLKDWYACEGPEVRREYHAAGRRLQLDAHQHHFRVVQAAGGSSQQETVVGASSMCQLQELKQMACKALGMEGGAVEEYELHDYKACQQGASYESTSYKTLAGNKLQDQQALLLVPKGQPGQQQQPGAAAAAAASSPVLMLPASSPLTSSPLRLTSSSPRYGTSPMSPLSRSFDRAPHWAEDAVSSASGRRRGVAGLGNLGNTCFMNSSLQCLAHSLPLMQTFLTGAYKADLNKDNPLSLGGKLALAFASLMEKLWQGGTSHVSPKLFKWQLAKFSPQFSGYAQQDSQELLAFLLDGLHEDLNRITEKPYVEDKDSDGRPDEEVAAEAWANYRRRNDSVIVDSFQGLYRSVLTCPQCGYKSVKFDPLMYLSLPLPSSKMRSITFTVVHVDGSAPPMLYGLEVPKSASVGQLYSGIAELIGLATEQPEELLLLTQFNFGNGDSAVYADMKARVSSIEDLKSRGFMSSRPSGHIYLAYRYPSPGRGPRSGKRAVCVYHKARGAWVIPPTPVYISDEELGGLSVQESRNNDSVVAAGREAIDAALQQLLRPFAKYQVPPAAEPAAADGASIGSEQQQQQADGLCPMEETPGSAAAAAAAEPASQGDAMDVEAVEPQQQEQQQQQPQQEQQVAQPPLQEQHPGLANGDAAAAAAAGDKSWLDSMVPDAVDDNSGTAAAAAPAAEDEPPLDIWAAQKEDAARAAEAAAAAAAADAASGPYVLKLAKRTTYNNGLSTYNVKLEAPQGDDPLLLQAEWLEAAQQLYDPAPLLSAERHASAQLLLDKQRDGGKSVSLADCLETFLHPEQLDAEDSWFCGKCKAHVRADKKLDLWSLPDVLVVHLKRFSYSRQSRDKLDTVVDFPLADMDMQPYLPPQQQQQQQEGAPPPRYDLYAVSNHYGGMGGGHYTAYCRMPDDEKWYTFDDSHVAPMEESAVKTSAAYVLFYQRQGSRVDVEALLQEHEAMQQQEQQQATAAAGAAAAGAGAFGGFAGGPAAAADADDADEQQQEQREPVDGQQQQQPQQAMLSIGGGGSGSSCSALLGKRHPETIDEELELEEESTDDIPAAGAIEID